MPDITGYRAKVGVIVPSTNTVVEHDTALLRPHGVTFHTGRMRITDPRMDSNANFEALILQIREAISAALADVMTAKPDVMMMGMSGETFWGGAEGHDAFHARVTEATGGLQVTTGAAACRAALEALGVRRIAVFSPYQPVADEQVIRYFTEVGFEIVTMKGLKAPNATAIAEISPAQVIETLREIDSPEAQAIVQVGTNLSMVGIADQAEHWLGKPVVAINAATIWHTLRTAGLQDTFADAGRLLREF
ncbi:maleate cis-trans isomerase family protein [Jiangella endophytica]|uniref:maleate cis-trans isomerase family protein n=1 Tax=Jiangella endophytica TaxID=1623398 RepID=UPI000E34C09E|nr:arylmalonate decarboxylase [Jiangella endophytica]